LVTKFFQEASAANKTCCFGEIIEGLDLFEGEFHDTAWNDPFPEDN